MTYDAPTHNIRPPCAQTHIFPPTIQNLSVGDFVEGADHISLFSGIKKQEVQTYKLILPFLSTNILLLIK